MLAGVSFGNSPVAGVHALAYPIGGTYHVPHGLSNALVLPYVLRFNISDQNASKLYSEIAPIVFPDIDTSTSTQDISSKFIEKLSDLSSELGLEQRLRDLDIPETACETMARDAMKQTRLLINNPREISDDEILSRLHGALINEGTRILEEGHAFRASDIDVCYVNGYGFAAHRGGPMWQADNCLLYTSPSPRDGLLSRMPSSA